MLTCYCTPGEIKLNVNALKQIGASLSLWQHSEPRANYVKPEESNYIGNHTVVHYSIHPAIVLLDRWGSAGVLWPAQVVSPSLGTHTVYSHRGAI